MSDETKAAREARRTDITEDKGFNENYQGVSTDDLDEESFSSDSFNVLLEEIKKVITEKASVVEMSNILEIAFKYPPMKFLAFNQEGI